MDQLIAAVERTSSKLPYALRESPVDPIAILLVSPLVLVHIAAFVVANAL